MTRSTLLHLILALGAIVAVLTLVQLVFLPPAGLHGAYYTSVDWSSTPAFVTTDAPPSTRAILRGWGSRLPRNFSVSWGGSILVLQDANYTLATASDDGSWLYIDDQLVVDNGGEHDNETVTGSIPLTRGVHRIFIRYFQARQLLNFALLWARDGDDLRPVPGWALSSGLPSFATFLATAAVLRVLTLLEWLFSLALIVGLVVSVPAAGRYLLKVSNAVTASPSRARTIARFACVLTTCIAGIGVYLFVVTAGRFPKWPHSQTVFYSQQADGFLAGQTALKLDEPSATYWDSSYYKGRNFIYWGPGPALLVAAAKLATGGEIPDSRVVAAFAIGLMMCRLWLAVMIGARLFGELGWELPLVCGVFAFAAPDLFLLARPAIYEAAIIGSQLFLLAGICILLPGMMPDISSRRRTWTCLGAGACWTLAIACRATAVVPVVLLVAATAFVLKRWTARVLLLLGAPEIVGLVLLAWFNKVRFDSWFELGTTYQVGSVSRPSWTLKFVLPNLYSYLFRTPYFSCRFPFVSSAWFRSADAFPSPLMVPSGYLVSEPTIGLLWVAPWFLFGAVALAGLAVALPRFVQSPESMSARQVQLCWLVCAAFVLAAGGGFVMMGMPLSTMRFAGDMATGLSVLSVIGFLWMLRALRQWKVWARWVAFSIGVLVAAYTVGAGLLLGVDGYYDHFKLNNPALYKRLSERLSMRSCW